MSLKLAAVRSEQKKLAFKYSTQFNAPVWLADEVILWSVMCEYQADVWHNDPLFTEHKTVDCWLEALPFDMKRWFKWLQAYKEKSMSMSNYNQFCRLQDILIKERKQDG